jgi:hypothetical protein
LVENATPETSTRRAPVKRSFTGNGEPTDSGDRCTSVAVFELAGELSDEEEAARSEIIVILGRLEIYSLGQRKSEKHDPPSENLERLGGAHRGVRMSGSGMRRALTSRR